MTDDYDHLPVSPDELQDELEEAHGDRPSSEAAVAAVEAMREDLPEDEPSDDDDEQSLPTVEMVEALNEAKECPLCGAPLPATGLPGHLVEKHSA